MWNASSEFWSTYSKLSHALTVISDSVITQLNHSRSQHIGRLVRMSILDTEVDGSNPSISMFFP